MFIGQHRDINIFGQPYITWQMIFDSCYHWEWVSDKIGNFRLINWPMPGGVMKQYNHVIEILNVIKQEAKRVILKGK